MMDAAEVDALKKWLERSCVKYGEMDGKVVMGWEAVAQLKMVQDAAVDAVEYLTHGSTTEER